MTQHIGTRSGYQSGFGNEFATEALPARSLFCHRMMSDRHARGAA